MTGKRGRHATIAGLAAVLVALCAGQCWAQGSAEPGEQTRPRTCLVLSGGGARGAAHVGALEVLEELRVPIDCIAGTSMGGIVGGMYASGLSPGAIEAAFLAADWEDLFDDSPPRKQTSFRRKEDDLLPLFPFELGIGRKGLSAPAGLIAGQKLSFLLRTLTLHTVGVDHFDHLRIPFRAVAADLADGSMVVLDRGSLAEALRAGMAVPGVFTPVRLGDRTLVDGGVARNLPVDVAQGLGAERIIAIDVGTPLREPREDETIIGVVVQTLSILSNKNVEESRALLTEQDLLIEPNLGDVQSTDFREVGEAIELGKSGMHANAGSLRGYSVSEEEYGAYLRRQRLSDGGALAPIRIDELVLSGSGRVHKKQILGRIQSQPGTDLNLPVLRDDLERLYQIGEFEQVDFQLLEEDGLNRLLIETRDKSWGPGYLRAGLALTSDLEGESEFVAIANYRKTQLNQRGAEWKTIVTIGGVNSLTTEFFQPIDYKGFWFVAPRLRLERDEFVDATATAGGVDLESYTLGVDVGVHVKNYAELTVGAETGHTQIGTQFAGGLAVDRGGLRASVIFDQIDNTYFPSRGSFGSLSLFRSLGSFGADQEYDRLELRFLQAWTVGRHTVLGQLRYGTEFDTELPVFDEFELGGFANLSGLQTGELRGDVLGFASLTYYQRFGKLYLGGALEAGNVWQDENEVDLGSLVESTLVFLGRETLIGPLYVGYGFADAGKNSFHLFLGRFF